MIPCSFCKNFKNNFMPNIFKKRILDEKIQDFQIENFKEKIEIVKKWYNDYHNGTLKTDKETSREQAFNQDFFIKILGYQEKPETPYTLEPKQTTEKGQLPDVVLGHFDNENKQAVVVVELKGASIPLDRPQRRDGNMSPIQQAFKYKNQYRSCPFVLASNFFEFRLFQDNQLDYEIWNLDDLVDSENDYYNFKKFCYLLCAENLIVKEGKSKIEELLSDIRIDEENISKSFYKEYKDLRTELLRDIYSKNKVARENIDLAIEKAQKVIDRIVFVCFCEDKGLLPEHILQQVLKSSENSFGSLWSNLKGFFEQIDKGSEKLEIPDGYNGGLFARDNDLNQLEISDDILKKFTQLGRYNFEEDMSVSILGHIFEQSISDLEEIKSKANQASFDIKESKRKKDGIFYTPDYIVNYIIKNSLGKFLLEKEEELKRKHNLKADIQEETYVKRERLVYDEYRKVLEDVKVLDPACGSGAFLVGVFDFLLAENKRVNDILGGDLFSQDGFLRSILRNNIYGVDINQESVEITKLSLWLKTAVKGKKLTSLDGNIKCGNSLVSDVVVAGERAFDWDVEFGGVMGDGGFDVVLGNPPYGAKLSKEEQNYLKQKFDIGSTDTAILFMKLAHDLTSEKGCHSYIIPNPFIFSSTWKQIREEFLNELNILVDCGKVWSEVKLEQIIYTLQKNNKTDFYENLVLQGSDFIKLENVDKKLFNEFGFLVNGVVQEEIDLGVKIKKDKVDLFSLSVESNRGAMFQKEVKENGDIKVLGGINVQQYYLRGVKGYVEKDIEITENGCVRKNSVLMQRIISHIQNPTDHIKITGTISEDDFYIVDTVFQISLNDNFSNKYILAIMHSHLMNWFVYRFIFAKAIRTFQFSNDVLKKIPIPEISKDEQQPFINLVDEILEAKQKIEDYKILLTEATENNNFDREIKLKKEIENLENKVSENEKGIDDLVYKLYDLSAEEIGIVEGN